MLPYGVSKAGVIQMTKVLALELARFKVPREFVFVDDLPRTALGKVRHFMLRQIDSPAQ